MRRNQIRHDRGVRPRASARPREPANCGSVTVSGPISHGAGCRRDGAHVIAVFLIHASISAVGLHLFLRAKSQRRDRAPLASDRRRRGARLDPFAQGAAGRLERGEEIVDDAREARARRSRRRQDFARGCPDAAASGECRSRRHRLAGSGGKPQMRFRRRARGT